MHKTKIDWCDATWNPVWGCLNHCPYCYARKIAERFGKSFEPHWMENNFNRAMPKKPSRIFVNSMSDVAFWQLDWMERVLDKIGQTRQHQFLFLTKKPETYFFLSFPGNCWLGSTTTDGDMERVVHVGHRINFLSIEPIHSAVKPKILEDFQWIIIGAETGNRKGKVIPERRWIADIVGYCKSNNIPVFLKEALQEIWGEELIQEFPR